VKVNVRLLKGTAGSIYRTAPTDKGATARVKGADEVRKVADQDICWADSAIQRTLERICLIVRTVLGSDRTVWEVTGGFSEMTVPFTKMTAPFSEVSGGLSELVGRRRQLRKR